MGRPLKSGPSVVVNVEGDLLVWTDGHLTGNNKEHIKAAKWLSTYAIPVEVNSNGLTAEAQLDDPENPLGALAAILGIVPGRGIILEIPESVLQYITSDDVESYITEDELNDSGSSEDDDYYAYDRFNAGKVTAPDGTVYYSKY